MNKDVEIKKVYETVSFRNQTLHAWVWFQMGVFRLFYLNKWWQIFQTWDQYKYLKFGKILDNNKRKTFSWLVCHDWGCRHDWYLSWGNF